MSNGGNKTPEARGDTSRTYWRASLRQRNKELLNGKSQSQRKSDRRETWSRVRRREVKAFIETSPEKRGAEERSKTILLPSCCRPSLISPTACQTVKKTKTPYLVSTVKREKGKPLCTTALKWIRQHKRSFQTYILFTYNVMNSSYLCPDINHWGCINRVKRL